MGCKDFEKVNYLCFICYKVPLIKNVEDFFLEDLATPTPQL